MSDARYDAIVAGGGHHATIIAPYLARAGMSVLVLERTAHLGGGACASEGPAPGYVMNHCSHWTRFYGHPAYRDFGLYDEGLRYLFPDENEGMIFDDGSSFVGYSASRVVDPSTGRQERSERNVQRTWEQIARFSNADADTYLRLLDAYERHWKQAFRRHRFSVPPPWGTPDPLEALLDVPGSLIEPVHQFMTLRQLAQDFFESPELQILFMRAATTSTGCFPDDVPGLQGLIHCIPLTLSFEPAAIAVGGSQAITDALVAAGRRLGVEYLTSSEVDRVTVAGDRATGVELADGSRIAADLVVSDLGLGQAVLRLLRDVAVDHRLRRRIENIHYDRGQLLWANLAIHEPPAFVAERDNPGVGSQPRLYWGPKDLDYLHLRYQPEIFMQGFASRPYVLCSVDSLWDETRAPAGSHIIGVEEFSAPRRSFSSAQWRTIRERFADNLLREWARYAPNMTAENLIATRIYTPDDIERERPNMIEGGYSTGSTIASQLGRFRPVPELTGHRVLLDNLYDCSANLHSGSGIGRGSSYNCFQEIARALRLEGAEVAGVSGEQRLAGKRVIVTGAAQGLGREFALHLAGLGAHVIAADIRPDALGLTCDRAQGLSGTVTASTTDVSSPEQTRALADAARDQFGGLDALVNNAAIVEGLQRRPFDQIAEDEWDRVLEVNVKGAWLCAKAVAPLLRDAGAGSIVNLASEVALSGSPGLAHYVTSKAAIIGMTRVLARELGPSQVRVNALAPGFIETDGSHAMLGGGTYDTRPTPLGRVGQPADLLGALAFLVSDESAFVTGQTLLVNGGRLSL